MALKLLLRGSAQLTIRELTGASVETWIDVELPKIQNLRVDLLGETAEGGLVHLELQSSNDSAMALRMAEYSLGSLGCSGGSRTRSCCMSASRRFEWKANSADWMFSFDTKLSTFAPWMANACWKALRLGIM